MTIYTQPVREIPWAINAATEDIAEPPYGMKESGWPGTPAPRYDWFNWVLKQAAIWIQYLRGRGIPDYDPLESYSKGDIVQYATTNSVYRRILTESTCGVDPTNATYWQVWPSDALGLASSMINGTAGSLTVFGCRILWDTVEIPPSGGYPGSLAYTFPGSIAFASGQFVVLGTAINGNLAVNIPALSSTGCTVTGTAIGTPSTPFTVRILAVGLMA